MQKPLNRKKLTIISAIFVLLFGAISAAAMWQLADREELINNPTQLPK